MNFKEFKEALFKAALDNGCSAAEVYCVEDDDFLLTVRNGEADEYSVSSSRGLNLRVCFNGKNGYAYTEAYENAGALALKAIDNARAIENTDDNPMQGKCEYPRITQFEHPVESMSPAEKIEFAKKIERETLAYDERVSKLYAVYISTGVRTLHIHNTLGLEADSSGKHSFGTVMPILKSGDELQEGYDMAFGKDILDYGKLIKNSVERAAAKFNASSVESGKYRVLIENEAMCDLLSVFSSIFCADTMQKGLSLLKGMEGKAVASDMVTILDDPFEAGNPRAFDAEGVPSVATEVVRAGVFTSALHNLKTAAKANVVSTSNAGRSDAAARVDVSPSNLYIVPGEKSFDELITELGSGLIITELDGLHAGVDSVSGDFSLSARGRLVENGRIVRSVNQITCAGNFLSMMKDILAVGSDLKFVAPGSGRIGAPSILVRELVFAGK